MFHLSIPKNYILLAVFGIIILLLVLLCVLPLLSDIQKNSNELMAGKSDGETLRLQSDQIESFKKKYEDYKPDLELMSQVFIDPQNPVSFIEFLEDTAIMSSVKPEISLLQDPQNKSAVTFNVLMTGDFLNILDFSKKVENGPYLVEIQNIVVKNADSDFAVRDYPSGEVDASFSINAFAKP